MLNRKVISIYDYWEPHSYLQDLYSQQKKQDRKLNYQSIATKAGIKSTAQLTKIFQGVTKITDKMMPKLAVAFELSQNELQYFHSLVYYSRAQTHTDKTFYFDQLIKLKNLYDKPLDKSQYQYFSHWYYVAIRELLTFYVFEGDYKKLAGLLTPKITVAQAKKAISTLEKLSLIVKDEHGIYKSTYAIIKPSKWEKLALNNFLMYMIEMATQAFDRFRPQERDISTLTVSLSEESLTQAKQNIAHCRKKILDLASNDKQNKNGVYQCNIQLFPLAQTDSASSKSESDI